MSDSKTRKPVVLHLPIDMNQLPQQLRMTADDNGFEIIPDVSPRWAQLGMNFVEAPGKRPKKKKTWLEKKQRRW